MKSVPRILTALTLVTLAAAPAFAGSDDHGFRLIVPSVPLLIEEADEKDLIQLELSFFILEGQSYPLEELSSLAESGLFLAIDAATLTSGAVTAFRSEKLLDEHLARQAGTCNRAATSCAFFSDNACGTTPGSITARISPCLPPNTVANLRPIFGPGGFRTVERGCGRTLITGEAGGVCVNPVFAALGIDNPPFCVGVPAGFNFACGGCATQ